MEWVKSLVGGLILTILLLSLATSYSGYLLATHGSCSPGSAGLGTSTSVAGNSSAGLAPAALASGDLVLAPLANLSLSKPAPSDLTNLTFWAEVDASQLKAYEQIVPQTVIGFLNSSEEWRAWALQNIPDPPGWLTTGFVAEAQSQVAPLDPVNGYNESAAAVRQGIDEFAASAAGVTLASLDYLTFNGLTGLQVLFETNDPLLAACQTLPGQLAQLYTSSFDPGVPQGERADYLGRALAITSVMLLVGGKDGLADGFQAAVGRLGLGDAWPAVKPYLGDIGSKVSAGASSATLGILQTLAGRFPQDSAFVTGFTADRVDSMVDVLQKKGVSDGAIQGDIQQVAQAAAASSDEQAPGETADAASLRQAQDMLVKVKANNKIVLYYDGTGRTATIRGTFLQQVVPGFDPRGPDFVQVHYKEAGVTVYQYYEEKVAAGAPYEPKDTNWGLVAPDIVGKQGDIVTVSFDLLTTDTFLKSVPAIEYLNTGHANWVSDFSEVKSFALSGNQVEMSVEQEPLEGVSSFVVDGTPDILDNSNGDTFLKFSVPNVVQEPRVFKLTFDGYGKPLLGIQSGSNFNPVSLLCSDGVRLRVVSDSGGNSVTVSTLYLQRPTSLYEPGLTGDSSLSFPGASRVFVIDQVTPLRGLEDSIIHRGSSYELGRIGAEIAYTVVQQKFGVDDLKLNEISQGGADLISGDKTVTVQARMLRDPSSLASAQLVGTLNTEMGKLVSKIVNGDFEANSNAKVGYAVLSYLDPSTDTVSTLVAVVPRS